MTDELDDLNDEYILLQDSYEELNDEHEKLNDKYLRLAAEFDNYKKRVEKDRNSLSIFLSEKIILSLLPVLDDMERSLISEKSEGMKLVYNKFVSTLNSLGVTEVECDKFDTDLHDAISTKDAEESGLIYEVLQRGYKLNDKVIRHAKVIVTK